MPSLSRRHLLSLAGASAASRVVRSAEPAAPLFEEVPPSRSGLTWTHQNAMSAKRLMPETIGPGVAFLDYDNDGWMDLYLVNSGPSDFWTPPQPVRNALYRNNRDGTFTDVTDRAGVAGGTFGMGVAVGDYDNDGWPDLLVTSYGRCLLYRNNRDGTFTEVGAKAGLPQEGWTTSAVWFDFDGDGRLDLFLCSYIDFRPAVRVSCGDNKLGRSFYCTPRVFRPTASLLYRNNGDGTFTEVGRGTEVASSLGKALGVVAADLNNDNRLDLFVANDTSPNFLFLNRGPGKARWEEVALSAEVAYSANGQARSGMGVDAADLDGDGLQDLFVANIDQEMFSLYRNDGDETFTDVAHRHSVAQSTRQLSGWGLKFFDFDNDGALDLILANGHPDDMIESYSQQIKYREPLLLFRQEKGLLRNVSAEAGPAFQKSFSARGLAVGDLTNSGRLDVLVGVNGGPPLLLRNNAGREHHWLGLTLRGTTAHRDAVGAKVTWSAGGVVRSRQKTGGGSFLSSHDPRMVLGTGMVAKLDWVEVRWPAPSRHVDRLVAPPMGRYLVVVEGKGIVP